MVTITCALLAWYAAGWSVRCGRHSPRSWGFGLKNGPDRRTKQKLWCLISILTVDVIHGDWSHSCLQALGLWSPWSRPRLYGSVEHNIKHCWRRVWKPSSSIRTIIHTAKEGCVSVWEHTECNFCERTREITQVLIKVSVHPVCTQRCFW